MKKALMLKSRGLGAYEPVSQARQLPESSISQTSSTDYQLTGLVSRMATFTDKDLNIVRQKKCTEHSFPLDEHRDICT